MNVPSPAFPSAYRCPVEATLDAVGGKWKALLLWHLMEKPLRFNELGRLVPQATPKMLTQQLRELERDGLVSRAVYPVTPPKVEYSLTELGGSLLPLLRAMRDWGEVWMRRRAVPETAPKTASVADAAHEARS